jgi:hypothetical protein
VDVHAPPLIVHVSVSVAPPLMLATQADVATLE